MGGAERQNDNHLKKRVKSEYREGGFKTGKKKKIKESIRSPMGDFAKDAKFYAGGPIKKDGPDGEKDQTPPWNAGN